MNLRRGVNYQFTTPRHPLSCFVERFWQFSDAPSHRKERIVPSGTFELVFNLHEDELRIYDSRQPDCCRRFTGAVVSGTYREPFVIDTREHASIIGVHFRPGGAFPFLGAAASEVCDMHVDLASLWGSSAVALRERLCAAGTAVERFRLLEEALMAHRFRPLDSHAAVRFALAAFERGDTRLGVREVAQEAGLSQRRFIQVFAREVGMSPKLFCRVRRFQQALAFARQSTAPDWGLLAQESGYFDQSHLIHDFRTFSGFSPAEYVRRRSDRVLQNHIPVV